MQMHYHGQAENDVYAWIMQAKCKNVCRNETAEPDFVQSYMYVCKTSSEKSRVR